MNTSHDDLYHHMLMAKDPETGEGFSKKELWCEALLLIIAGTYQDILQQRLHVNMCRL